MTEHPLTDPIILGDLHSELVYAWNVLTFHADTIRKAPQIRHAVLRFIKMFLSFLLAWVVRNCIEMMEIFVGEKVFHWAMWRNYTVTSQLPDGQETVKCREVRTWYSRALKMKTSEEYHSIQMNICLHDVKLSLLKMAGTYPKLHGAELHRRKLLHLIRRVETTAQHVDKPVLGHARGYLNSNHDYGLWLQQLENFEEVFSKK